MEQLLENTLLGGVMILTVAVLRRIFRGRLSPNVTLLLWAVCFARLMTPVSWRSGLSIYALPALAGKLVRGSAAGLPQLPASGVTPAEQGTVSGQGLTVLVYLAGAAVLAALFVLVWCSTRRVRSIAPGAESDPRRAGLPAGTVLREGDMRGAPLTFGALRPNVVLTPGLYGPELRWVLAHEGFHVRRRDNLWHYAMAAAVAVHWFNPAVWLMAGLVRRDVEMSCDRAVLRRLGADRRAEYANTLIALSTKTESPAFCRGFGPKRTEERIVAIMKFKKTTFFGLLVALTLVLCTTVAFATSPEETEDAFSPAAREAEGSLDYEEQTNNIFSPDGLYAIMPDGQVIDALTGEIIPNLWVDLDASDLPIDDQLNDEMNNFVNEFNKNHPNSLPPAAPKTDAYVIMPDGQVEVVDRDGAYLPGLDRMKEEILKVRSEISGLRTEIRALEEAL